MINNGSNESDETKDFTREQLIEEIKMAEERIRLLLTYIYSDDGFFTFADGCTYPCKKRVIIK